jgi:hypothetical protein
MHLGVLPLVLSFLLLSLFLSVAIILYQYIQFCFSQDLCLKSQAVIESTSSFHSLFLCGANDLSAKRQNLRARFTSVYRDLITENEEKMKCTSLLCLVVAGLANSRAVATSDGEAILAGEHFRMAFLAPRQTVPVRNLQVFTGALGGVRASAITNTGDPQRQFGVDGDTFVRLHPWVLIRYSWDEATTGGRG